MKGGQIFQHSFRQVTGNLEAALRVSGVLYLAQYSLGILLPSGAAMSGGSPAVMMETGLGVGFAPVVVVIVGALELVTKRVFSSVMVLGLMWTFAIGWLQMIVGVSILTTPYGHYIEKRALV